MGRDYLKCAVLCYNLGRWKFERSIRRCMEFKYRGIKVLDEIKFDLLFNKIKKMYSPFLISVVLLGYFIVFGGFEVFVVAFIRRSQGWTEPFRTSRATRLFSRQNSNPRLDFPFRRKEGKFIFLLVWSTWKKLHPFRFNSNDLCITTGAFSFPEHLVPVFSTTAQLEIKLCDRSSVTTATDRTGAQSKFRIKNLTLSPRPHGSILMPLCNVRPIV